MENINWLNSHKKHIFVLSGAGKPVFSFHEDFGQNGLAICALVRALAYKAGDELESVTGAQGLRLIFCRRGHLLLVCSLFPAASELEVSTLDVRHLDCGLEEPNILIQAQLEMLYNHLIFHVTRPALERLFERNVSYDLAGLLGGTEVASRNLVKDGETALSITLDAIPVVGLPVTTRMALLDSLEAVRDGIAAFAFLITRNGDLIAGLGPKTTRRTRFGAMLPHARNFVLLANFVKSNPQLSSTEMWTPLCLPLYDDSGHFQVYCSQIQDGLFLVLLTADNSLENFHEASRRCLEFKEKSQSSLAVACERMDAPLSPEDLLPPELNAFRTTDNSQTLPIHIAVRCMKDECAQYLETKKGSSQSLVELTSSNRGDRYLVKRYSILKSEVTPDDSSRLLFDVKMRDAAIWYREAELEIMALFPPMVSQIHASNLIARIKALVLKNRSAYFCFPTAL